jgi:hypothetical protein
MMHGKRRKRPQDYEPHLSSALIENEKAVMFGSRLLHGTGGSNAAKMTALSSG